MTTPLILIVEDEIKIARVLQDYLHRDGYRSHHLERGDAAVAFVQQATPALLLLDIELPGLNGVEICQQLRANGHNLPIMMITGRIEETDRLLGLEVGADDYICKPFSPREVVARVKAVLRRTTPTTNQQPDCITIGQLSIWPSRHAAQINEQELSLTKVEFSLLITLANQADAAISRNELLNQARGLNFEGYERNIDSHIKNLRKKLSRHTCINPIRSVYGVGYRLDTASLAIIHQ